MRKTIILACVLGVAVAIICRAQNIETRILNPKVPTRIVLNPNVATTVLLPSIPSGTFGLGLASQQNPNGSVQLDHPDGSAVLVLRALTESAHICLTVLMDGQLFVFDVQAGSNPDIALTLVKAGSLQDSSAPRAVEVTPEEIKAARPKYDPEILIGLLRRARDVNVLRPVYPDLYQGYKERETQYTSENEGVYKTTVVSVHRFSREDALVLQCVVQNEQDKPLVFDGRATTIEVANEIHPVKLLDCLRPIPPHAQTLCDAVIQGDVDGGRANLSIDNEFRLILPVNYGVWSLKNGGQSAPFTVPRPTKGPMPLTQNRVKRDPQQ